MVFMSINMLCKAMQNVGQKKAVWKYIHENYTYYVKWCKTTDYDRLSAGICKVRYRKI